MEHSYKNFRFIILIFVFIIAGIFVINQYYKFQIVRVFYTRTNNDFPHFYFGSEVLKYKANPYDDKLLFQFAERQNIKRLNPFVYLPFTGLILMPLTFFNIYQASDIWFVLNHIWLFFSLIFLFFSFPQKMFNNNSDNDETMEISLLTRFQGIFLIFVLASFSIPFYINLSAGQMNTFLLLIYSVVFFFYIKNTNKTDFIAGAFAGFGAMFKIAPGILLVFFMIKKKWYSVLGMISAVIILFAISFMFFGIDTHLEFIPTLKQMGYGKSTWEQYGMTFYKDPPNQSINSFFHHILSADEKTEPWLNSSPMAANIATYFTAILIFLLLIFVSFRINKFKQSQNIASLDYSLFIFLSLLIPSLMWDHYTIQLWIVYYFLFLSFTNITTSDKKTKRLMIILKIIFFLTLIWQNLFIPYYEYNKGFGLLLMSAKLWGVLILMFITISHIVFFCKKNNVKPII